MERQSKQLGISTHESSQFPEIVSASPAINYKRGVPEADPGVRGVLQAIFARKQLGSAVKISWVHRARYRGAEYEAGLTWLSAIVDERLFYAFIPTHGMFEFHEGSGQVWLFLEMYPEQGRDDYGLPVLKLLPNEKPTGRFMKLHSRKIVIKTTMCVSRREEQADGAVALRFTPLL